MKIHKILLFVLIAVLLISVAGCTEFDEMKDIDFGSFGNIIYVSFRSELGNTSDRFVVKYKSEEDKEYRIVPESLVTDEKDGKIRADIIDLDDGTYTVVIKQKGVFNETVIPGIVIDTED